VAARHQHGHDDRDLPHGLPHPKQPESGERRNPVKIGRIDPHARSAGQL